MNSVKGRVRVAQALLDMRGRYLVAGAHSNNTSTIQWDRMHECTKRTRIQVEGREGILSYMHVELLEDHPSSSTTLTSATPRLIQCSTSYSPTPNSTVTTRFWDAARAELLYSGHGNTPAPLTTSASPPRCSTTSSTPRRIPQPRFRAALSLHSLRIHPTNLLRPQVGRKLEEKRRIDLTCTALRSADSSGVGCIQSTGAAVRRVPGGHSASCLSSWSKRACSSDTPRR
jgi:hypothetical protein